MRNFWTFGPDRAFSSIFLGFTVFVLCFQGSFYLFEYRNGDTLAPTYFKLLKDAGFVAVFSLVLWVGLSKKHRADAPLTDSILIIGFCFLVTLTKLIEWAGYGTTSVLLLTVKNLVLYAAIVPALSLLDDDLKDRIVKQVMIAIVAVAFAQVLFSAGLFVFNPDRAFWTDDPYKGFNPFVGFFSNPNRFALFLNLAVAALCAMIVNSGLRASLLAACGLIILALANFYTAALSQLIVYFGLLFYATAISAVRMRWLAIRIFLVAMAASISIGLIGTSFKSPWPGISTNYKSPDESELAWNMRNISSLIIHGKTLDGRPFRFTSDSVVNRVREVENLLESFGIRSAQPDVPTNSRNNAVVGSPTIQEETRIVAQPTATPTQTGGLSLWQRLFGRPDHAAPASQSQYAYIYFRYGLVGLTLFVGILLIPALSGGFALLRSSNPWLMSYHLCLVAFIATFLGDNGLLDFPTNFLLFFVLFANHHLAPFRLRHPSPILQAA